MQRQQGNAAANFQGPVSGFRDWGLSFQGWGQLGRVGEVGGVTGVAEEEEEEEQQEQE